MVKAVACFAASLALAAAQSARAGEYWVGGGDGYWGTGANWYSGDGGGYFFSGSSYSSKTVKFNAEVSHGEKIRIEGANNATTDADPIVFLADDDSKGLTTSGDFEVGVSGVGHLAIRRGTFQFGKLEVGGNDNTGSNPVVLGGGEGKVKLTIGRGGDTFLHKGALKVLRNATLENRASLKVGRTSGLTGELVVDGGSVVQKSWFSVGGGGPGILTITNGVVTQTGWDMPLGDSGNSPGIVTIKAGGRFVSSSNYDGNGIRVGCSSSGTLNVQGGEVYLSNGGIAICAGGADGEVNITSGLVTTRHVKHGGGGGTATLTIDGGTLRAYESNSSFIPASDKLAVYVGNGGATIDSNGFGITISENLDNVPGEVGTATFAGVDGTITLDGAVNYTGVTKLGNRTHLVLKDAAMKSAILSHGLTVVTPVGASSAGTYTLLTCADGTAFTDADISSITLGDGLAGATLFVEDGAVKITKVKTTQTWAGAANASLSWGGANWDGGATWIHGNDAVFATDGAIACVDAAAAASSVTFCENAAVTGSATLAPTAVSVASGKTATISAPTAGALDKSGAGTLELVSSRSDATTLSEGTLVMSGSGTTLDFSKLSFGTDPAKPVALCFTNGATAAGMGSEVRFGNAGCTVSVDKNGGDWTCNGGFRLGHGEASATTFRNRDGALNIQGGWTCFGDGANSTNEFYMAGGSMTANDWFILGNSDGSRNYFEMTGGTFAKNGSYSTIVGYQGDEESYSEVCVKGGVFNANTTFYDSCLSVGQGCYGVLTVDGGEVNVTADALVICQNDYAGGLVSLKSGKLSAPQVRFGKGNGTARLVFDGGTLQARAGGTLIADDDNFYVYVGANGGTIDANGKTVTIAEPLLEDAESTGGGMTFKGGGSVTLAAQPAYTGLTTVEVGTALTVPSAISAAGLALVLPAGLADGLYSVVSVSGETTFAANYLDSVTNASHAAASFFLSGNRKTVYCVRGELDNIWIGGTSGSLSDPDNWAQHVVPVAGMACILGNGSSATLTVGDTFAPDSITFPAGSAAITIVAEDDTRTNVVAAITNLSSSVQTIACPLAFADTYRVHCETHAVNFSGGVTATYPDPDNTDNAASHTLMGDITFTENWAQGKVSYPYTLPNGSVLYGVDARGTDATATSGTNEKGDFLSIEPGGAAWFETVFVDKSKSHINTDGELHVAGILTVGDEDTGYSTVCPTHDQNDSGSIYVGGLHKYSHGLIYIKTRNLYVGKDGFGAKVGDYYFIFGDEPRTVHATDDFEIFSPDDTKDWGIRMQQQLTIDTAGHTITWNASFDKDIGTYEFVKDGEGTLVFNPKRVTIENNPINVQRGVVKVTNEKGFNTCPVTVKDGAVLEVVGGSTTGTGAVTVESGATLAATNGVASVGGALTLEDGARLSFNFTTRRDRSTMDLASSASNSGTVAVVVSTVDGVVRPFSGRYTLTSGGKFKGTSVALAADAPEWAKGVSVDDNGDIVLDVKPMATKLIIR